MKADQFCYWLQGIFEGNNITKLDEEQVTTIKNHLKLVFLYDIDPSYTDNKILQHIMQNVHDGKDPMDGVTASLKNEWPDLSSTRPTNEVRLKC